MIAPDFVILGDNIIECERALNFIYGALRAAEPATLLPLDSAPNQPRYTLSDRASTRTVTLRAGHGRWPHDLKRMLEKKGAKIIEHFDALVYTGGEESGSDCEPLLAMEFCSSLPAGNNAWQRLGRAVTALQGHVPYLYFVDLGGTEFGKNREAKSSRFPNPLLPFAFIASACREKVSFPGYVVRLSPDYQSSEEQRRLAEEAMRLAQEITRGILLGSDYNEARGRFFDNVLAWVDLCTVRRARQSTFDRPAWERFARALETGKWNRVEDVLSEENRRLGLSWRKDITLKRRSAYTDAVYRVIADLPALSVGASELPICVVPRKARRVLAGALSDIIAYRPNAAFINRIAEDEKPLVVVWIAGFKPGGEDSRPDRGLVPLALMLFGELGLTADIATILYGPVPQQALDLLERRPEDLADSNFLWDMMLRRVTVLLIPGTENQGNPAFVVARVNDREKSDTPVEFALGADEESDEQNGTTELEPGADVTPAFLASEQDIDTVLHRIFVSDAAGPAGLWECMCNPPGGDWSALLVHLSKSEWLGRYTSLPRVSEPGSKRPDHVIEVQNENEWLLVPIESKADIASLRRDAAIRPLGERMILWCQSLLKHEPNQIRKPRVAEAVGSESSQLPDSLQLGELARAQESGENLARHRYDYVTMGAALVTTESPSVLNKARDDIGVDVLCGLTFDAPDKGKCHLQLITNQRGRVVAQRIAAVAEDGGVRFEISQH